MALEFRLVALCTALSSACAAPSGEEDAEEDDRDGPLPPGPVPSVDVHYIDVDAFGVFTPDRLTVDDGDMVVWRFHDRFDSVVRIKAGGLSDVCNQPAPYVYGDPFELTGPMPVAAGGIFALNPSHNDPGLVVVDAAEHPEDLCDPDDDHGQVGTLHLCAEGQPSAVMDSTWSDPSTSGVFIRLDWVDL